MRTITLTTPLKRGEKEITEIVLHEPNSGHLRGVSLSDLMNMKADAIVAVAPRISEPKITEQEMARMGLRDLTIVGGGIVGFFLSDGEMAEVNQSLTPPLSPTE